MAVIEAKRQRERKEEYYYEKLQQMHIDVREEINRDKTFQLLLAGLKNLSELKEKWSGMAHCYENVKKVIGQRVAKKWNNFKEDAEDAISDESSIEDILAPSILEAKLYSCACLKLILTFNTVEITDLFRGTN